MKNRENMNRCVRVVVIILVTLFGASCGGGGGSSGGTASPTVSQGQFLDSPVEGLSYTSGGVSGVTDTNGTFSFEVGQNVQFSIGGIVVGEAFGQSIITPVDLVAGAVDENDPTVTNISRFLQTLDDDGDPNNGITISEALSVQAAGSSIDFTLDVTSFENDANVLAVVSELTSLTQAGLRDLISSVDALNHLRNTLLENLAGTYNGTYSGDDSGTWTVSVDAEGNISGSGFSNGDNDTFSIDGTVLSSGDANFAVGTAGGAVFSGAIESSGEFFGTWQNMTFGDSGSFTGSRI